MQPDKVVQVPGLPHTFGLATARNMLRKLEWEIGELPRPDTFKVFRAFNVVVTACHLADWVWREMPRSQRAAWGGTKSAFLAQCERDCPPFGQCRRIANSSKHGGPDERGGIHDFATISVADVTYAKCGIARCGDPMWTAIFRLSVKDCDGEHPAEDVFARVLAFWRELIDRVLPEPGAARG